MRVPLDDNEARRKGNAQMNAEWFALVMNAAASLEDAANSLRDPDAKKSADGAAAHFRAEANRLWLSSKSDA